MIPPPQYKYPEGSDWERRALYEGYEDLLKVVHSVEFKIPEQSCKFGEDVTFVVRVTNKERQHRIKGKIRCIAVSYTGRYIQLSGHVLDA